MILPQFLCIMGVPIWFRRNTKMKSVQISLEVAQTVKEFVAITQSYDFEIVLRSGKYIVDAKSILGIFSLDLSKPLTVEIYNDDCAALLAQLDKFKI